MTDTLPTLPTAPPTPPRPARPVTRIGGGGRPLLDLRGLYRHRELLVQLARRDVSVRFKQTVLGFGWAVAQPLAAMLVFVVFLGRLGELSNGVAAYPLFVLAGTLPWTYFANIVAAAGQSVVANERLITKVYFPRLVVPLSAVGSPLVDFGIGVGLLAGLAAWYAVAPGWSVLALPLAFAVLTTAAVGVGVLLSALIVAQRDFKILLGFGLQLWMFATPCIYLTGDKFGPTAQTLLPLNPAYGSILAFRQAALGGPIDWYALGVSAAVAGVLLVVGLWYFRRVERLFADLV